MLRFNFSLSRSLILSAFAILFAAGAAKSQTLTLYGTNDRDVVSIVQSGNQLVVTQAEYLPFWGVYTTPQISRYPINRFNKITMLMLDGNDDFFNGTSIPSDVNGGPGSDSLEGGSGADQLIGGKDDDFIRGNGGDDDLYGSLGSDMLWGGPGNDSLDPGPGGSPGTMEYAEGGPGIDVIYIYSGGTYPVSFVVIFDYPEEPADRRVRYFGNVTGH